MSNCFVVHYNTAQYYCKKELLKYKTPKEIMFTFGKRMICF